MDNAQGYGYKTKKRAYAAYTYKNRDKSKDEERQAQENIIRQWLKEHRPFVEDMDRVRLEIKRGSYKPGKKFNTSLVREMLRENHLEIDFPASSLLKVYLK